MDFHNFDTVYVFKVEKSISGISTELPCLRDLENRSQLPVREVLMILSYEFLKFSHYSCFLGQGIIADISTELHCYVCVTSKIQVDFRFKT